MRDLEQWFLTVFVCNPLMDRFTFISISYNNSQVFTWKQSFACYNLLFCSYRTDPFQISQIGDKVQSPFHLKLIWGFCSLFVSFHCSSTRKHCQRGNFKPKRVTLEDIHLICSTWTANTSHQLQINFGIRTVDLHWQSNDQHC